MGESLSPRVIEIILAAGGPTFVPLARQKFRCNQVPALGKLTKRQCESLRRIMHPANHFSAVPAGENSVGLRGSYRVATVEVLVEPGSTYGSFVCPYHGCGSSMYARLSETGRRTCSGCGREIMQSVQTMPEAIFESALSVRCPYCSNLNSSVYNTGKRICSICARTFYARRGAEYAQAFASRYPWL